MCKFQIEKQGAPDFLLPQVRRCHHITKNEEKWLFFVHGVNFIFFFLFFGVSHAKSNINDISRLPLCLAHLFN